MGKAANPTNRFVEAVAERSKSKIGELEEVVG